MDGIIAHTKKRELMMTETILKIEEVEFDNKEGFAIVTDKQKIVMGISSNQSCCENFGYFWTNDSVENFVGAKLLNVSLTDTLLKTESFDKEYAGDVMFVNFETNKGTLQFVAYNEHNGYYGHEAVVVSTQLDHTEYL